MPTPVAHAIKIRPFLVGGTEVDPSQWPAVVQIKTNLAAGCTATIVGPRAIFTSAGCGSPGGPLDILINGKMYSAKFIQSPNWLFDGHGLAIGVANETLPISPLTVSMTKNPTKGMEVRLLGYGCLVGGGPSGKLTMGQSLVGEVDNSAYVFETSTVSGPVSCPGDGGGPVLWQNGAQWELVGVTYASTNVPGGNPKGPNATARVSGTEAMTAIRKMIQDAGNPEVCGINKTCDGGIIPSEDPSCTFEGTPATVRKGDPLTLTLASKNAVSGTIDGNNVSVPRGTYTFSPMELGLKTAQGFVMSAKGKVATCSTSYTVTPTVDPPTVSCTITVSPTEVVLGGAVTMEMNALGPVTSASIDGSPVQFPVGRTTVIPKSLGEKRAIGFVSGTTGSANCEAKYLVKDSGPLPPVPNYGIAMAYCGADLNAVSTQIARVCLGTVKQDTAAKHVGFTDVVHVKYADGKDEVLPIVARRPVGASTTREELGLYASSVIPGKPMLDMRLATVTKVGGSPSVLEGTTITGLNFRANLTAQ